MAVSSRIGEASSDDDKPMSEINTTPLVDVMLVLLIIFLITIPVITQSVKVELPKAANIPTQTKPENVNIAVDKEGNVYWNTMLVTQEQLLERLRKVGLDDAAIADLIGAASFFNWANRLMLSLGEPATQG